MAFPSTPLLDVFNRANGAPGAMWTGAALRGATFQNLQITSNQLNAVSGNPSQGYWNASTPGPDCEAYATPGSLAFSLYFSLVARAVQIGANTTDGYQIAYGDETAQPGDWAYALYLGRIDNGVVTMIGGTNYVTVEIAQGVGISCEGSAIKAHWFDGVSWSAVVTATDSSHAAAGRIGVAFDSATSLTMDDFGGGTIPGTGAFPQTAQVDSFTRADDSVDTGPSWTQIANFGEMPISSNGVAVLTDATRRASYWNAGVVGPDCEVIAYDVTGMTVPAWPADSITIFGRLADPTSTLFDGYAVLVEAGVIYLQRFDNGSATLLASSAPGVFDSDDIGLECRGSTIKSFHGTGVWTQMNSVVDATYAAAGYVGALLFQSEFGV